MSNTLKKDALAYHSSGRPGKIAVIPTKPTKNQRDLSLAYSPGVAEPCLAIENNPEDAYKYTAKGNLVAVISNGTAVLGLGDIGALASKPVMEGKGLLFKIFADIDVFDIELDTKNVDEFINIVKALQPTFGGINLEDIKAPECFEIEQRLKEELNIPVMHDDQHGTAIISGAALLNACDLQNKDISKVKIVVNGAGAAAISCSSMYVSVGASKENIVMVDSKGVINKNRSDLNKSKLEWVTNRDITSLEDAVKDADVFIGLSKADILTADMLKSMAKNPIVLAMANPNPEIKYQLAIETREDIIMGTGRSDYPNQVNNVLGFPYIFRGALDVRATAINEEMKIAAVHAIAKIAKEPVPDIVKQAYSNYAIRYGKEYIIPKPNDPRLLPEVSAAVAEAAIKSGVAREVITDFSTYKNNLIKRIGTENLLMRYVNQTAKSNPKRILFAEGDRYEIIRAAQIIAEEKIGIPVLLGKKSKIEKIFQDNMLDLDNIEILDSSLEENFPNYDKYVDFIYQKRQRKGITKEDAKKILRDRNYLGCCLVEFGVADTMISGLTKKYSQSIKPALELIGAKDNTKVSSLYLMLTKKGPLFLGDTTVNLNPSAQDLINLSLQFNECIKKFNIEPRIALLSYSNFGSNKGETVSKIKEAVDFLHKNHPEIVVDGDLQANFAVNKEKLNANFPFSKLNGKRANTLIFPNLESANIAYKLLQEIADIEAIGPILLGLKKPIHLLQFDSTVREIVNMASIAVVDAQQTE